MPRPKGNETLRKENAELLIMLENKDKAWAKELASVRSSLDFTEASLQDSRNQVQNHIREHARLNKELMLAHDDRDRTYIEHRRLRRLLFVLSGEPDGDCS